MSRSAFSCRRHNPFYARGYRPRRDDELGPAPCPRCGKAMVARLGKQGPYFYCLCGLDKGKPDRR